MISVIIPIYNVEKYLECCLNSVQLQSYKDFEALMIDDGSPDSSSSIAKKFSQADSRFKYFYKENGGLSSARNFGLSLATGEYIYFLDSDDWIDSSYLEELVNGFDDDTDIVISKYVLEDTIIKKNYIPYQSENFSGSFSGQIKEREILERHLNSYPHNGYLIKNTLMPVWKNMYRRKLLFDNKLSFVSEKNVGAEDYVFNASAYFYAKKINLINSAGYHHIIVKGSLSRKNYDDSYDRIINKYECIMSFLSENSTTKNASLVLAENTDACREIITLIFSLSSNMPRKAIEKIICITSNEILKAIFIESSKNFNLMYRVLYFFILHFPVKFYVYVFYILNKFYLFYRYSQIITRG